MCYVNWNDRVGFLFMCAVHTRDVCFTVATVIASALAGSVVVHVTVVLPSLFLFIFCSYVHVTYV